MMIFLKRTTAIDSDYKYLIPILDAELTERDGPEEHVYYVQYNKSDDIKHVVIAYEEDKPLGCGAIKYYDKNTMEVKRMFVPKEHRGKGISKKILSELEKWAMELGFSQLVLETGIGMPEAISLYSKNGYSRIPNYGQYEGKALSVCMIKSLIS
jgi:putative acetyltransferase